MKINENFCCKYCLSDEKKDPIETCNKGDPCTELQKCWLSYSDPRALQEAKYNHDQLEYMVEKVSKQQNIRVSMNTFGYI